MIDNYLRNYSENEKGNQQLGGRTLPPYTTARACGIVINELLYIAIFDYIRKEDCDVLFA
jgi:hypothetical protein